MREILYYDVAHIAHRRADTCWRASGSLVSGGVQEAGMSDLSRADPGPADSAVAAGSGESAVGSGLESLAKTVGSALG